MRVRSASLILAALALTAACGGGSGKPQTLPSLTPTHSAPSSPVAVPSEATVHNAFGAAAFVRFYYNQLNQALQQADTTLLEGLSDPACGTCQRYLASVEDFVRKRQHLQGVAIRIITAEAPPEQNGYVAVDVFMDGPARSVIDSRGRVVERLAPTSRAHKTVYVRHVTKGWTLRAVKEAA